MHRGEILAVMGPSGSGKSTLLNVISGRTDAGSGVRAVAGAVRVNNVASLPRDLSRRVAFVPQRDAHMLPFLTVFETVMYSAELQLPWYTPRDDKRARTMATLEELGLTRVANSRVGSGDGFGARAGGAAPGSTAAPSRASFARACASPRVVVVPERIPMEPSPGTTMIPRRSGSGLSAAATFPAPAPISGRLR